MYYTHPGCRTSIFGNNRAYCIRDFTVYKLTYADFHLKNSITIYSAFILVHSTHILNILAKIWLPRNNMHSKYFNISFSVTNF